MYVVGFLVRRSGWFQHLRVLPLANVKSISESEVIGRFRRIVASGSTKRRTKSDYFDRKPLPGSALITTDGHEVGRIQDYASIKNLGLIECSMWKSKPTMGF